MLFMLISLINAAVWGPITMLADLGNDTWGIIYAISIEAVLFMLVVYFNMFGRLRLSILLTLAIINHGFINDPYYDNLSICLIILEMSLFKRQVKDVVIRFVKSIYARISSASVRIVNYIRDMGRGRSSSLRNKEVKR